MYEEQNYKYKDIIRLDTHQLYKDRKMKHIKY